MMMPMPNPGPCPYCGEEMPKTVQLSIDPIQSQARWFSKHMNCDGVGLNIVLNNAAGTLVIGDPDDAEWTMILPYEPMPGFVLPATIHIPKWIFAQNKRGVRSREQLRTTCDLEFRGHGCKDCGGQHNIVTHGPNVVVDALCCPGHEAEETAPQE